MRSMATAIKPKMTRARFEYWAGQDNLTVEQLINLLLELANGNYPLEQWIKDVAEHEA